jgi:hypothetical protein
MNLISFLGHSDRRLKKFLCKCSVLECPQNVLSTFALLGRSEVNDDPLMTTRRQLLAEEILSFTGSHRVATNRWTTGITESLEAIGVMW